MAVARIHVVRHAGLLESLLAAVVYDSERRLGEALYRAGLHRLLIIERTAALSGDRKGVQPAGVGS